jgi:diguanylate cyclase (GGDEF)-like protein
MLLVIPATVPAFASGDDNPASEGTETAAVVSPPAEVAPVVDAAPAAEPAEAAPEAQASSPAPAPAPSAAPKRDKLDSSSSSNPRATYIEGDSTAPSTGDPTSDDPTPTDPTGSTDSTGPTGSTGSSGPVAGGGIDDQTAPPADTPAGSGAPETGDGTQPSGEAVTGPAPRSTGTLTEGGSNNGANQTSTGNAGENATDTQAILNQLSGNTNTAPAASGAASASRGVANRATDQIERNAESGVVASLVVTRIISQIPTWVFWALAALGLIALAGFGLFMRERSRRHSAEQEAMADELTGISNRKAFDRRLDLEWRRAARYGRSLGLMVMDLDGFKQVNDLKGHAAGDRVLRDVAQALDARMRDTDLVARIGGDEFAVICPETGINELMTIRRQLSEQATSGLKDSVGLSIGVAEYVPGDEDATSILARADESMYRVKRGEATALPA